MHAQPLEHVALFGAAGGGEDLGACAAGQRDRRHADAAGAGVDQDPVARLHPCRAG